MVNGYETAEFCRIIPALVIRIYIPTERPGYHLEVVMDGQSALGYLMEAKMEKTVSGPVLFLPSIVELSSQF